MRIVIIHDDESRRQGSVAAQVDFAARREPAQAVSVAFLDGKSRFRQVVFHGDALHEVVCYPRIEDTDCRRISLKHFFRKGVDNVAFHHIALLCVVCTFFTDSS